MQGINDLVTPFLTVFLSEHFEGPMEFWSVESLSDATVTAVEADSYWCLSRLLEGIQDHYTHAQPGIQRMVFSFQELVRLALYLLPCHHFAFRLISPQLQCVSWWRVWMMKDAIGAASSLRELSTQVNICHSCCTAQDADFDAP